MAADGFGGVEWGQYGRWKGEEWLSQLVCAHTMQSCCCHVGVYTCVCEGGVRGADFSRNMGDCSKLVPF
jgi:hypothetical protein